MIAKDEQIAQKVTLLQEKDILIQQKDTQLDQVHEVTVKLIVNSVVIFKDLRLN